VLAWGRPTVPRITQIQDMDIIADFSDALHPPLPLFELSNLLQLSARERSLASRVKAVVGPMG